MEEIGEIPLLSQLPLNFASLERTKLDENTNEPILERQMINLDDQMQKIPKLKFFSCPDPSEAKNLWKIHGKSRILGVWTRVKLKFWKFLIFYIGMGPTRIG